MSVNISDVNTGATYYFPITVKEKKVDKFSSCIVDTDGGEWDEFDVGQLVTRGEIISGATDEKLKKADDQIDFWKRDSESAHEEIRKLQEQVKILEDSNGQYVEQIRRYDIGLKNAEENLNSKQMTIIQTTKRCADLQRQLADFKSAKEKDVAMLTDLNKSLNDRIAELEADKARPVCISAKETESPKVEALRKALEGQGNDIRRKSAIINALAERVVYLEGEMRKNG
jgi:chromosome segregation ATPase